MNNYQIKQLGDYSYSLVSNGKYSLQLYSSIIKSHILTSAFHDPRKNSIFFTAASVQTLSEYLKTRTNNKMSERECAKLIYNISSQIQYLEENEYVLYGYNLNDILVINEQTFIVANPQYILPLESETKSILFCSPIIKPVFSSFELLELTNLPSSIHYKSSYYSLGVLVAFCILNKNLIHNGLTTDKELEKNLNPIKYSKVYWFIKRCLNKKYEQRVLLFI